MPLTQKKNERQIPIWFVEDKNNEEARLSRNLPTPINKTTHTHIYTYNHYQQPVNKPFIFTSYQIDVNFWQISANSQEFPLKINVPKVSHECPLSNHIRAFSPSHSQCDWLKRNSVQCAK